MRRYIFYVLLTFLCIVSVNAQKRVKVEKEYTYHAPENITLERAKQIALERAQTEAIADEFGTLIQRMGATNVKNVDGKSDVSVNIVGSSDVRGEWVRTIGEPEFNIQYADGLLIVSVRIKGEIRELKYLKPTFRCKLLRNGTKDNFEATDFKDNDYFYLAFESPKKGCLAVFVKDDSVRCLVPYVNEQSGTFKVKANKRYLFFTESDEKLQMFCSGESEVNRIEILFSTNHIERPLPDRMDDGGMAVYSIGTYNEWLAKVRSHDKELQMEIKEITISK